MPIASIQKTGKPKPSNEKRVVKEGGIYAAPKESNRSAIISIDIALVSCLIIVMELLYLSKLDSDPTS